MIIFSFSFSTKVTYAFLLQETTKELLELNTFKESDNIFGIIDQIEVSREHL